MASVGKSIILHSPKEHIHANILLKNRKFKLNYSWFYYKTNEQLTNVLDKTTSWHLIFCFRDFICVSYYKG